MKLGKLLAAGKSIMNGHKEISYRSSKQIYLPKFNSAKNPFKSDTSADPAEIVPSPAPTATKESRESAEGMARLASSTATAISAVSSSTVADTHARTINAAEAVPTENGPVIYGSVAPSNKPKSPAGMTEKPRLSNPAVNYSAANAQSASRPALVQRSGIRSPRSENTSTLQRFNALVRSALGQARSSDKSVKNQKGTATQTELSLDSVKVVHNDLSDVDVEVVPIKSRSAAPELPAPKKSWEYVGERLFGVEAT